MVWIEEAGWQVEGIISFSPNVVSFLFMMGLWRWYVVRAYVPPNNVTDVYCVKQALVAALRVVEIVLLGDLNMRLWELHNAQEEELVTLVADGGLVDMTAHFMAWRLYRGDGR